MFKNRHLLLYFRPKQFKCICLVIGAKDQNSKALRAKRQYPKVVPKFDMQFTPFHSYSKKSNFYAFLRKPLIQA